MGKQALISIIIPVYNVERYLTRCMESILLQSYTELEIILIDDGSTDNSGTICEQYARKDPRVVVIHKKNGGLSDARNYGLGICHGAYIFFVDSDDYIALDCIESLYKAIIHYNAEIAVCNALKFYGEVAELKTANPKPMQCFNNIDSISNMLYRKQLTAYAWGKLYARKLFEDIHYPVNRLFEDLYTTYKLYYLASTIVYIPEEKYFYCQRSNSIVNSTFNEKRMQQLDACEEILDFIDHNQLPLQLAIKSKILIVSIDLYRRIDKVECHFQHCDRLVKNIKKYRWAVFSDFENKYITQLIAFVAILSPEIPRLIGRCYAFLLENKIMKPKGPI